MFQERGRRFVQVVGFCLFFGCLPMAALVRPNVQDSPASNITAKYVDKLVMLRTAYCGQTLKFDALLMLVSDDQPGGWETCQGMRIGAVRVEDGKIKVTAQRVRISYDCGTRQVRVAALVTPDEGSQTLTSDHPVYIEIQLPRHADDATVAGMMDRLFRPADADLALNGRIYRVGPGVSPPQVLYAPEPDYSDKARQAKYQGTVVLTVVVGTDGAVQHAAVTRSLGMGLDENAFEKIKTWRFRPATMCGKPVAVEVNVEVAFSLDHQQ